MDAGADFNLVKGLTMQAWIKAEAKGADFGDERLNRRYELLLDRLSDKPTLSIPAACGGLAETTAAYRFFDNDKTDAARVLKPHHDATVERIRAHELVIVAQDTTEIELVRKQERVGGPLNEESRWGLYVHPLLAMTPERVPLGVVTAKIWSRDPEEFAKSQQEKRRARKAKPLEEKESARWLEGYQSACALAGQTPATTIVAVSDSEGDIYECLQAGTAGEAEYIVRGCQDRALLAEEHPLLLQTLACKAALGSMKIRVSKREASTGDQTKKRKQPRSGRRARVTIRAAQVWLRGPARPGRKLPDVQVNAILVKEENPPAGEEPIEWLLLTSLPVATLAEVTAVLDYYCCRWEIEIYFRTLKSGCKIEELQLERQERLEVCLAMYLIVAWRVLHVLMLGRECPKMRCDAVLSEAEWKSVYVIATDTAAPAKPPLLIDMVKMIAELGGYLNRKHDGPPGPQTMWIGLQRMRDFAIAWSAFGPGDSRKDV
jgi:Transposase DNA-binding/Transposase Tn5 dimerisation domain